MKNGEVIFLMALHAVTFTIFWAKDGYWAWPLLAGVAISSTFWMITWSLIDRRKRG